MSIPGLESFLRPAPVVAAAPSAIPVPSEGISRAAWLQILQENSLLRPSRIRRYTQQFKSQHAQPLPDVNLDNFDHVFVTSDVHADFRRLVQILVDGRFVAWAPDLPKTGDLYDSDLVYALPAYENCEWIAPPGTLLVILGDLVDGMRPINKAGTFVSHVEDLIGAFELCLHVFLYNLRIKARRKGGDILMTMGNHDMNTVIDPINVGEDWYKMYVSLTADTFFGGKLGRAQTLHPFYEVCPLFHLNLTSSKADRPPAPGASGPPTSIFMAHADMIPHSFLKNEDPVQESWADTLMDLQVTSSALWEATGVLLSHAFRWPALSTVVESRVHATLIKDHQNCRLMDILSSDNVYTMYVFGHCVVDQHFAAPDSASAYVGCSTTSTVGHESCIMMHCGRYVFVDTGMSLSQVDIRYAIHNSFDPDHPVEVTTDHIYQPVDMFYIAPHRHRTYVQYARYRIRRGLDPQVHLYKEHALTAPWKENTTTITAPHVEDYEHTRLTSDDSDVSSYADSDADSDADTEKKPFASR